MLEKIDQYIVMQKGEEPEEGWSGTDKSEATRLRQEFKREVLQSSGDIKYKEISKGGLSNDDKLEKISMQKKVLSEGDYNDYLTQLVRYEIIKAETLADYLSQSSASDELVYKIASESLAVLPATSNNDLYWELRKVDVMSDTVLRRLREDGFLTSKGYRKYKPLNSKYYEKRYESTKTDDSKDDLF
jgi:hypothetical protein